MSTTENMNPISVLAIDVRNKLDTGEEVKTKLATSQRIIARVTDGIYREPWAAFREMVVNSYDADATRVIVETGAPDFEQVIVRDNGNGMTPEALAYVLKSIGGSSKRTKIGTEYNTVATDSFNESPKGRLLVGKIGIGLFAVAQLTQHFQIITKAANSPVRISATVKLRTHDEEIFSEGEDEEYVAGDVLITSETVHESDTDTHGTTIVLYSLRPEIRRSLQSNDRWRLSQTLGPDGKPVRDVPIYHIGALPKQIPDGHMDGIDVNLPWEDKDEPLEKFMSLIKAAADITGRSKSPANLEHFDDYLKLIWQLSLALPLQYATHHPFDLEGDSNILFFTAPLREKGISQLNLGSNKSLRNKLGLKATGEPNDLPFQVFVDGVELRRPIELPSELRRTSRVPKPMMLIDKVESAFKDEELERAGGQLSFEAYLYWNSKIIPKETSGVLIRVREASGTLFDRSFLNYQISEQNRLSQITAEIFVHTGLDSAINIDRESFNYSHPHFLFVQKWLHRALRLLINRNKVLAKENLDAERQKMKAEVESGLVSNAIRVWEEKRGEDADLPVQTENLGVPPSDVGGVEIDWAPQGNNVESSKSSAIAIVLEAYGVLGLLKSEERAALIRDLLNILEDG